MDLSKLQSYEVTGGSHEIQEDGVTTNVLLEVSVVHADDPDNPYVWAHYLNDKTELYLSGKDGKREVVYESVITAFTEKDKQVTAAQTKKSAAPISVEAKVAVDDSLNEGSIEDFMTSRAKEIEGLEATVEAGRVAQERLNKITRF